MKGILKTALTIAAVGFTASAIIHRKDIEALMKGEPMTDPPKWLKKLEPHS